MYACIRCLDHARSSGLHLPFNLASTGYFSQRKVIPVSPVTHHQRHPRGRWLPSGYPSAMMHHQQPDEDTAKHKKTSSTYRLTGTTDIQFITDHYQVYALELWATDEGRHSHTRAYTSLNVYLRAGPVGTYVDELSLASKIAIKLS